MANLPSTIRAIALSQRGFGNSDKPDGSYHPRVLAGDLADFMTLRRIPRAILAGHSMGALVAQRFALDFPERVAGLVLIGTFKTLRDSGELAGLIDEVSKMSDPIDLDLVRGFQASTLAQPVSDEFFRTVVAGRRAPAARHLARRLDGGRKLRRLHGTCADHRAHHPVLGRARQLLDLRAAAGTGERNSRSRARVYAGAGHSLHWEEPRRFAADLGNFVRTLERTRRASSARGPDERLEFSPTHRPDRAEGRCAWGAAARTALKPIRAAAIGCRSCFSTPVAWFTAGCWEYPDMER